MCSRFVSDLQTTGITAAVFYSPSDVPDKIVAGPVPTLVHVAGKAHVSSKAGSAFGYAGQKSANFATPFNSDFDYAAEAVSHTRSLTFLKRHMGGPYFDLEQLWDEHTFYEFGDRSVENTMNTMVQEPYVNHIPTVKKHRSWH